MLKPLIKKILRESLLNEESAGTTYTAYHGSETKINKFLDDFVGGKEAKDQNGPGIYFTSSWNNARSYGGYVYTVKLSPKKILSNKQGQNAPIKEIEWLIKKAPNWQETAQNWDENPMRGLKIILNDFIKYNDNPNDQFQQVWIDFYRDNPVDYVRNMVQLGYDALIISDMNSIISQEENITHTIVFNPSIIQMVKMEDDTENN
jgi:hypothetical protein